MAQHHHFANKVTRRSWHAATVLVLGLCTGCRHSGAPIIKTSAAAVGGTIAGIVEATGGTAALNGRMVTAVNVTTGERYEATTGVNGGYTINVPNGIYRLEVELRDGETLAQEPDATRVTSGDLSTGRDFDVTKRAAGRD
jgi:hypothetical protein